MVAHRCEATPVLLRRIPQNTMKPNPVGWFEIYVQNMDRARAFYQTVFQVSLEELPSPLPGTRMVAFPMNEGPGAAGALVLMPGVHSPGLGTLVYFNCTDCAVESSRVPAAGGRVERPKFSIAPFGFIALVRDSEGNAIGLHSRE